MIQVIDNFLSKNEIEQLYDCLWKQDWNLSATDKGGITREDRGWAMWKILNDKDIFFPFYNSLLNKVLELELLSEGFECKRMLVNAYKFGDVMGIHTDDGFDYTAIIYCNHKWEINWGSETIFVDEDRPDCDIIKSVIPKPGRLVIFDSSIPHTGRVPNSVFPNYRYSLVFNLVKK